MSRFSKYVREKVVKVLVAALVAGSVAGNEGITVQAAGADLNDPFSFVLYTNGKLWGKILSGRSFCSESDS